MQVKLVIRIFHCMLTTVLIIAVLVMGVMLYFSIPSTPDNKLLATKKINDVASIYVTVNDRGSATVPNSYRYYIFNTESDQVSIVKKLNNSSPFLITNDENSVESIQDGIIRISTSRKVYYFNNLTGYYLGDQFHPIPIHFSAR